MPKEKFKKWLNSSVGIVALLLLISANVNGQSQTHSKDSLVVSFISIGAGTDYKAKEKLTSFVNDFQNQQAAKINVKIKHWGREGETDYIYDLTELTRKQCKAFVEEIEAMFSKNNLVRISHSSVD